MTTYIIRNIHGEPIGRSTKVWLASAVAAALGCYVTVDENDDEIQEAA